MGVPSPLRSALSDVSWKRLVVTAIGAVVLFVVIVVAARGLRTLPAVQAFIAEYPGHSDLPRGCAGRNPAWLAWQHFFNAFLLVMIVRTGLIVRRGPDRPRSGRVTTHVGRALTVLRDGSASRCGCTSSSTRSGCSTACSTSCCCPTGQWVRIVPTDWSVVPNSISVVLQYASLEWPVENSWVSYNDAQVLSYFAVVFIASPLAIITGLRLSPGWPMRGALSKAPPEWFARALHYPVMLFFLLFTFVHVVLVLTTSALRNLNHMYAAREGDDWVGFVIFAVSIVAMIGGWVLARPLLLVPVAERFGSVRRMPQPQRPPAQQPPAAQR